MYIKQIKLKNFGKFHNKTIDFGPGINLIYGENESGKTTLFHFIKSMLFGIERQRGKAAKNDIYSLYEPWENALFYEGELRFNASGRNFRIERGFQKVQKVEKLINEDDAEELSIAQGDLLHILDGLNESVFKNTMAISQLKNEIDEGLAVELKNYTSGISLSGDGGVNVGNALASVLKRKKEFESKLRELASKKQVKLLQIEREKEYIQIDLSKKQEQLREYNGLHKSRKEWLKNQEESQKSNNKKISIGVNVTLIILTLMGIISLNSLALKASVTFIFGLLLFGFNIAMKKQSKDKAISQSDAELNRLIGAMGELKEDIHDKEVMLSNIGEKLLEVEEDHKKEQEIRIEIEALELAYEKMQTASFTLQKEIGEQINETASHILSLITNEKYNDIRIDSNISTRLNTSDKIIYPEQVSKGTVDEINFAVRMAFLESFFPEESMPVFLDDAFVMYDNNRLQRALKYLADSNRQVIIMTCHKREEQLMEQLQIPFQRIQLL